MTLQVENDFLRFVMMVYEIVPPVCKDYLRHNVLTRAEYNGDLKTFLNKHMHDIYHLVYNVRCCQCGNPSAANNNNKNRLFGKQFEKLYEEKNAREQGHVRWGPGRKIIQHCICGYTVVEVCSVDEMDISTVNALIQTCVQGIDPSHSMWLNQIIKKRNKLCHIEDICALTKDNLIAMWVCIECSVLGLAQCIPPKTSYKKSIEREVKLLKRCEFQREEVQPVLDSMKMEIEMLKAYIESMKEQQVQIHMTLNGIVQTVPQQIGKLEECMVNQCRVVSEENEAKKKEIQNTVIDAKNKISEQIGAQAVITSNTITESRDMIQKTIQEETKKQDEKLNTILQEVKKERNLHHRNQEVEFNVELSEQGQNMSEGTGDVFVTWKISKHPFAEKEQAEIIQNIRKVEQTARQTAALWLPDYKIELIRTGSIVIATLLNKDVLRDNEKFESSIRLFLDRFLVISGIDCTSPCTIDVKIVISESPLKGTVDNEETNKLLAKYFDKIHQVVPEMLEESSEGVVKQWIKLPLVYSLNLSPTFGGNKNGILLISDKSDADITRQIVEMLPRDFIIAQKKSLMDYLKDVIWRPSEPRRRCEDAYVVIADTNIKRTAIKVALELLECTTCIALVPSDGLRYNDIYTESIVIDKNEIWKESLLQSINLYFGLINRRYLFAPPVMVSYRQYLNSISIVIVSSILDQDKTNIVWRSLQEHIGSCVFLEETKMGPYSIDEKSNSVLVLSQNSELFSRTLKVVDPIVVSFSKGLDGYEVITYKPENKTWAQELLSRIAKKNKDLPCFIKVETLEGIVWFCSLMRDKQILFEVREQTLASVDRKLDREHFKSIPLVVLLSGDSLLDNALLNFVSRKDPQNNIKLFLPDVPNKNVTDDEKRAFYDDLLSKITNIGIRELMTSIDDYARPSTDRKEIKKSKSLSHKERTKSSRSRLFQRSTPREHQMQIYSQGKSHASVRKSIVPGTRPLTLGSSIKDLTISKKESAGSVKSSMCIGTEEDIDHEFHKPMLYRGTRPLTPGSSIKDLTISKKESAGSGKSKKIC